LNEDWVRSARRQIR